MKNFNVHPVMMWIFIYCGSTITCFGQNLRPERLPSQPCPGDIITFSCETTGSSIIAWASEDYIGSDQLEFGTRENNIGDVKTSSDSNSTVATLTGNTNVDGNITLKSELQITISAAFQNSTVTCLHIRGDRSITFSPLAVPEDIRQVMSIFRRNSQSTCTVDLVWDFPPNHNEDDVSHFVITINETEHIMNSTNTNYCLCDPHNVTVAPVDRCGRTGSSVQATNVNIDTLQQSLFGECSADIPTLSTTFTTVTVTHVGTVDNSTSDSSLVIGIAIVTIMAVVSIAFNLVIVSIFIYCKKKGQILCKLTRPIAPTTTELASYHEQQFFHARAPPSNGITDASTSDPVTYTSCCS